MTDFGTEIIRLGIAKGDHLDTPLVGSNTMINLSLGLLSSTVLYNRGLFSPSSLFSANEPGGWYDPSDLTTMFQDAAGTTAATLESPVGLVLDKSKGLVLGSELVDTANTAAAWTKFGGNTVEQDGDAVKVTFVDNANGAYMQLAAAGGLSSNLTQFKRYKIVFEARINTGGANITQNLGGAYASIGTSNSADYQTFTAYVSADGAVVTNYYMQFSGLGAGEIIYIRNISVRELPGNHLSQSTSTARPVLSARVNLLSYSEQFDNAYWGKNEAAITANATTAPNGTTTADALYPTVDNPTTVRVQRTGLALNGTFTFSCRVKKRELSWVLLSLAAAGSFSGVYFNIETGQVGTATAGYEGSIQSLGDGWYRCSVTATIASGDAVRICLAEGDNDNDLPAGSLDKGVYIWGADLRPANAGVGLPAYQRVGAATSGSSSSAGTADYDATGFPYYLKFDGTDDFLVSGTIDPGSVDKAQVFAGVRKLSDAAQGMVAEFSAIATNNNGSLNLQAPAGASPSYRTAAGGSIRQTAEILTGFAAPITNTLTSLGDISGDLLTLNINGNQTAQSVLDQGTGNFGSYPFYVGARYNAPPTTPSSLFFNGHLYSLILRFSATNMDAATIAATETWVNQKTLAY